MQTPGEKSFMLSPDCSSSEQLCQPVMTTGISGCMKLIQKVSKAGQDVDVTASPGGFLALAGRCGGPSAGGPSLHESEDCATRRFLEVWVGLLPPSAVAAHKVDL